MVFVPVTRVRLSDSDMEVFQHPCGLRHVHLHDEHIPPTFMIAFPTVPVQSDGRTHVLEHLVLSGSRRFPVHEMFSRAHERSMASYMNAMTGEMETCYPFVTPHLDDFEQLLDVYLDAVFHPCLARADFLAEGFRETYTSAEGVIFQGVVFNEMTGATEDPDHHTYAALRRFLYPDSALGLESGGDPLAMTALTHEQVVAFHQKSYHPAHAVVFTAGPRAVAATTQTKLATVLSDGWPPAPPLPVMPLFTKRGPQRHTLALPVQDGGHQWLVAWHLGSVLDGESIQAWVRFQLFHAMWLDESSPFMQAHQTHQWGRLGPLSGVQNMGLDQWLVLHFQGLATDEVGTLETLVHAHARQLADEGLSPLLLNRIRRDVDIDLRQQSNRGPEGAVHALFEALNPMLYDPMLPVTTLVNLLDIQACTEQWDKVLTDPEQVKKLAQELLATPAELILTGTPDDDFQAQRGQALDALQAHATREVTHSERRQAELRADQVLLEERETTPETADVLPAFPVTRIPHTGIPLPAVQPLHEGLLWVPAQQQGLARVTLAVDLSEVDLSLFNACSALLGTLLPGMGDARHGDWIQATVQRQQAGIDIEGWLRTEVSQTGTPVLMGAVQGLARADESDVLAQALVAMVQTPDWSDVARLDYLIQSECEAMQDRLVAMGDQWMTARLAQGIHRAGDWQQEVMGLPRAWYWLDLANAFAHDPEQAIESLKQAWQQLAQAPWHVVITGDAQAQGAGHEARQLLLAGGWVPRWSPPSVRKEGVVRPHHTALVSPQRTSGYHGMAWAGPTALGTESADLALLGPLLTQAELNPRIRTLGGAYGSQAAWERGVFHMTSWNDPRLTGTLEDFEATRQRALQVFSEGQLAHAQRLVFQRLDSPRRPFQQATLALHTHWRGDTPSDRQRWREALLAATPERVRATAQAWLAQPALNEVGFIDDRQSKEAQRRGLTLEALLPAA